MLLHSHPGYLIHNFTQSSYFNNLYATPSQNEKNNRAFNKQCKKTIQECVILVIPQVKREDNYHAFKIGVNRQHLSKWAKSNEYA